MKEKILVLHVRNGYEDRQLHIDSMMSSRGYAFEYVTEGDMCDLNEQVLDEYFTGNMHEVKAETSCAMKHLLACKRIVDENLPGALVLEDDMVLYSNFERVFDRCMKEIKDRGLTNAFVSFEDSILKFVPRSERIKGQHLYKKDRDRYAGAYYCTRDAAKVIIDFVEREKCHLPIDLLHSFLSKKGMLNYYWCQPTIATQGSHMGLFSSSINKHSAKKQRYRKFTWKMKLAYKKLIYFMR